MRVPWLLVLLLAGVLVRAVPLFSPVYYDPDHYYHERLARLVAEGQGIPAWDPLSYGGRPYTYYPFYHELLALPSLLLSVDARTAYALASLGLALASLLAVYVLAARAFGKRPALGALLFFALTPLAFVRATAFARPDGFALALLALAALAASRARFVPAAAFGLSLALANLPGALFGLALFSGWVFLARGRPEARAAFVALVFLLVGLAYYFALPWASFQLSAATFSSEELRSLDALSIFAFGGVAWVFALWGVWTSRKERWARPPSWAWAWLVLGLAALALVVRNLAFAAVPVALLAGAGFEQALRKTKPYRRWLAALVLVTLAVQAFVYFDSVKPVATPGLVRALEWAGANTPPDAVFLSLWDRGHLITGVAGRRALMDGYFEFAPAVDERHADSLSFFHGSETNALRIMRRWGATHVLVDERMPAVLPYSRVVEGIRNWKSFEELFDNGAARIYRLRA